MRAVVAILVASLLLLMLAAPAASGSPSCAENQHLEGEPPQCVCDEGYEWDGTNCVPKRGPDPSGCRPYCLLDTSDMT